MSFKNTFCTVISEKFGYMGKDLQLSRFGHEIEKLIRRQINPHHYIKKCPEKYQKIYYEALEEALCVTIAELKEIRNALFGN